MSDINVSSKPEAPAGSDGPRDLTPRKRILLVEGDGFTRLVLLLRLRLAGFAVDFTSNGILGLAKLRTGRPDVLLLDLRLNGLSGLELMKAARAEPTFGNRPIYVFTHTDRIHRNARKELVLLATKVFDKNSVTREDLVQTFAANLLKKEPARRPATADIAPKLPAEPVNQAVVSEEIKEIVAGVREQYELLSTEGQEQQTNGAELRSRVCSLGSCAEAAGLTNLARQATALERFLQLLTARKASFTSEILTTISRAVDVMSRMSFAISRDGTELSRFSAVVVDEAAASKQALDKALSGAGFEPAGFEDPRQARQHLASHRADLIIANLSLPEAHGLALADIRNLPLHAETPVLFGPESSPRSAIDGELPTSAPRLENESLLLAELIVKALNEVQSRRTPSDIAEKPAVSSGLQPGLVNPGVAENLASEDGFDLFAQTSETHSPNDSGIPEQIILRAQPAMPAADRTAEFLIRLPETSTDESVRDERPVEVLQTSTLQTQTPEPIEPETTLPGQAADIAGVAAADPFPDDQTIFSAGSIQQNEAPMLQEAAADTANYGDTMNNQLHIAPADYAPDPSAFNAKNSREDLAARACAAEMALYHAKAEVERKDKTIEALQSQLAEAAAERENRLAGDGPSLAEQQAQARCAELEQEVASLRQAFEGFSGGFGEQQQSAAETDQRIQELQERLHQSAAELAAQQQEQERAEAELRQQLQAAEAATAPVEAARQQTEARCAQLEQELATLRQAHAEATNKLAQKAAANSPAAGSGGPESESEQQVRHGVAALAKATADLAKERGERQRAQQRAAELNQRMQALHDDLKRTLQTQSEDQQRIGGLEAELHEASQNLERRTADLEQQRAEQQLLESQLQKTKEANAQLRKDLAFFDEANKKFGGGRQELQARLESSLNAARESELRFQQETAERQRLAENLEETKRELQNQARRRENLEQELQVAQQATKDAEARSHKEISERQRLGDVLRSVQGNAQDSSVRDLELTKLQSSLELEQVERKRQETQLARIRQKAVDAAHAARALRTNMRRQIREPVESLVHATRSLLELEMGEQQKQLAETVLQDVLLVQMRLREPDLAHSESGETDTPDTPA